MGAIGNLGFLCGIAEAKVSTERCLIEGMMRGLGLFSKAEAEAEVTDEKPEFWSRLQRFDVLFVGLGKAMKIGKDHPYVLFLAAVRSEQCAIPSFHA